MEYLEETQDLRKKSPIDKKDKEKNNQNKPRKEMDLTPSNIRKNSESFMIEINANLSKAVKDKNNIIIGMCGGQSCGKSLISLYMNKNLYKSAIISEKDFFIGNKERRKSTVEEKLDVLNMTDDDYSINRKNRLADINNINNFDFESLANCLKDYKDKKSIEIPTWDKEKGVQ